MAHIIVYDFETVGRDENQAKDGFTAIPVSIAAKAYHGDTLEPFNNGEFYTLIKPDIPLEEVHDSCFHFLKMTRDMFVDAPSQKQVWTEFQQYAFRYSMEKNNWTAPISAGMNIDNFDRKIAARLTKIHLDKLNLFSDFQSIDLLKIAYQWFSAERGSDDLPNFQLVSLLKFCRIPFEESLLHNAQYDVSKTGELLMKFLKWQREVFRKHRHYFGTPES